VRPAAARQGNLVYRASLDRRVQLLRTVRQNPAWVKIFPDRLPDLPATRNPHAWKRRLRLRNKVLLDREQKLLDIRLPWN
jgi:hypothetical protein